MFCWLTVVGKSHFGHVQCVFLHRELSSEGYILLRECPPLHLQQMVSGVVHLPCIVLLQFCGTSLVLSKLPLPVSTLAAVDSLPTTENSLVRWLCRACATRNRALKAIMLAFGGKLDKHFCKRLAKPTGIKFRCLIWQIDSREFILYMHRILKNSHRDIVSV